MPECPSVAELIAGVKILTRADGTFQTAWSDSFTSSTHCCEQGGFIYVDFPILPTLTRAYIVRAPKGASMNQRKPEQNASIDLNKPGIQMDKVILAANFHTHPLSKIAEGDVKPDPKPSTADMTNAWARGVPGIVISRDGIYSYGPTRREKTNNPKGYPETSDPPSFNNKLEKAHPPPTTVKNQWPEGTGSAATASLLVADEVTDADNGTGECEVIYVEWSSSDVEYGEPLAESEN